MTRHSTLQWSNVMEHFRMLGVAKPQFAPLADAVTRIALSRYAAVLFPVKSANTLVLFQADHSAPDDAHLRLDGEIGELILRYVPGAKSEPQLALTPVHGAWKQRGSDVLVLLERSFHHLQWFAENRQTATTKAVPTPTAVTRP
jgi:hypothetical protein